LSKLFEHTGNIDNDTVTEQILSSLGNDGTGDQMEGILLSFLDDGVSSICTSIESGANVILISQHTNKLAFAFITPLGS
jgi:hypothetical protein